MGIFRNDSFFQQADENYIFDPDDLFVGVLISVMCLMGFLMQGIEAYGFYRLPNLKSTFGILMMSELFAQFAACFVTFWFYFLGLVCQSIWIITHSRYFGNCSLILFPVLLGANLLMSFNRFCASSMPFKYRDLFTKNTVSVYITISWCLPTAGFSYFFVVKDCNFVFFKTGWVFMEALKTKTCNNELVLLSITYQFLIFMCIMIFDVITLVILLTCRRKVFQGKSREHAKREINFAKQVFIQGIILLFFGYYYTNGYKIVPTESFAWAIFVSTTFTANVFHCTAPFFTCLFNAEFRRWMLSTCYNSKWKKSVTIVSSRVEPSK